MTEEQLLLESLEKRIEQHEKNKKIKDKKELNEITQKLMMQVKTLENLNIIQRILADEFLQRIKNKYMETMKSEQFKLHKQETVDMEDGVYTEKENIIISERRNEKEHMKKTMNEWEQELKQQTVNKGLNKFEKETPVIDKEEERSHNIEERKI